MSRMSAEDAIFPSPRDRTRDQIFTLVPRLHRRSLGTSITMPRRCRWFPTIPNEIDVRASKRSIFIGRVLGYFLAQVPQLDDAVVLESEYVHDSNARGFGILPRHERMRDHHVSVLIDVFDIDGFVRVSPGRFFHGEQQGLAVALEVLIVMNEVGRDELLVSGPDISAACHFQE